MKITERIEFRLLDGVFDLFCAFFSGLTGFLAGFFEGIASVVGLFAASENEGKRSKESEDKTSQCNGFHNELEFRFVSGVRTEVGLIRNANMQNHALASIDKRAA